MCAKSEYQKAKNKSDNHDKNNNKNMSQIT